MFSPSFIYVVMRIKLRISLNILPVILNDHRQYICTEKLMNLHLHFQFDFPQPSKRPSSWNKIEKHFINLFVIFSSTLQLTSMNRLKINGCNIRTSLECQLNGLRTVIGWGQRAGSPVMKLDESYTRTYGQRPVIQKNSLRWLTISYIII